MHVREGRGGNGNTKMNSKIRGGKENCSAIFSWTGEVGGALTKKESNSTEQSKTCGRKKSSKQGKFFSWLSKRRELLDWEGGRRNNEHRGKK